MTPLSDAAIARLRQLDDAPVPRDTRYEVLEEIGRGGMGIVYRVRDRELGRDVALKVVPAETLGTDAATRLLREARALARLEHPGIVPIHDVGELADGRVYYAMKLVQGERLDQRLASGISLGDALRLFIRICEAVAFAHARGVIHRDLKPQNVMIAPFGDVLVMDWGVAKVRDERPSPTRDDVTSPNDPASTSQTTLDGVVLGTPGYMAPEQASGRGDQVDERTDVYTLGIMLREIAERGAEGAVPPPLASIITKATASSPQGRYTSADLLRDDVSAYLDRLPISAHRETIAERIARIAHRHRLAVTLVLAYLLVRLVMLAVL